MNGITDEWLAKADGDFVTANREFRARKLPNYDSSCFHAQQYRGDLIVLDRYGVRFRYPGDNAIKDEAKIALTCVSRFRAYIRNQLGLA
jgi:hypothetical protein